MQNIEKRHPLSFFIVILPLLFLSCATPKPDSIPAFREGVVIANQQTMSAFSDINEMLKRQQLDRAANQPTINEDLFAEGLPASSRATWSKIFLLMEEYADNLEQLISQNRRETVEEQLRELGVNFQTAADESIPAGISAGFVKLGGLLVDIKAGQDALENMQKVDPAIQEIFSGMAFSIGNSQKEGVRLTVWSAWITELSKIQVEFLGAANEANKRRIAEKYLNTLYERDAHDLMLNSLRISFLSLGSAHSAMAQGNKLDASAFIKIVQNEYKAFREEVKRLREKRS
jgi:hypothetical protein